QYINSYVKPGSHMLPLSINKEMQQTSVEQMDMSVYTSDTPFPDNEYAVKIGSGINDNHEHVTFVTVEWYPVQYIPTTGELITYNNAEIDVSYKQSQQSPFPETSTYDLVIIAPNEFSTALQPLIDHKNNRGIETTLKTTEGIYAEYDGIDEAEQIKYFIKDAVETWGTSYVLLIGGLKSTVYAKPRDNMNLGASGWHVPVRYTNMYDDPAFPLAEDSLHDPGVISDLYYADLYKEGGIFTDWDSNNDGVYLAMGKPGVDDDENIDFYPDVSLSRLACRNIEEVNTVVNKIITYENTPIDPSWFEKMIVVSGDGFLDQEDLNIKWDTTEIPDDDYTIYAQSFNPEGEHGYITNVNVTKDKDAESKITYSHNDHLNPAIKDAFTTSFPTDPVAEIVSVSEGDILGNTDISFDPPSNDYCNEFFFWANVSYVDEVLTIRGKSYDPKPYGNLSSIHIWIKDSDGNTVFSEWRNNTEMYYEGEWTTGEKALLGRGGALYYMPEEFEKEILWTSNGELQGTDDVLSAINGGSGFLFFSGHGSPNVWADQYPGIPGDRAHSSVTGMEVTKLSLWNVLGLLTGSRNLDDLTPMYPMDLLSNGEKLPIAVVGGCHNSQFNVSMIPGVREGLEILFPSIGHSSMWCHGYAVPETFSWRLIQNPNGGAIASMGNTGLGYGMPGKELTTGGGDSWITIEFFRQYGEQGQEILGDTYRQTLNSYIDTFDMTDLSAGHPKTITQWVLLGDPTLKIGGYE
ncbi:MAG: peptidase C25, partial [Candidatus Thermoplasmatota archaeon]|nr:peptidase C25 [Candidatus Thermoplasmatota archaeon]